MGVQRFNLLSAVHGVSFMSVTLAICHFDMSHTNKCEVMSHDFDFISLMTSDVENLFMHLLAICLSSLGKHSLSPMLILKLDFFLLS